MPQDSGGRTGGEGYVEASEVSPRLRLYPYQVAGAEWLATRRRALLADEMGLGKTIQAIRAAEAVGAGRILVVCPASIRRQWVDNLVKHSRLYRDAVAIEGKALPPPGTSVVMGYTAAQSAPAMTWLKQHADQFHVLVFDEAHYLKNMAAARTQAFLGRGTPIYSIPRIWCLTGTPVLNEPAELYPMLRALANHTLQREPNVENLLNFYRRYYRRMDIYRKWQDPINLPELADRVKGFYLRRTVDEVLPELPAVTSTEVKIPVPTVPEGLPTATEQLEIEKAKIPATVEYLENLLASVNKVVVICQHRSVLHALSLKIPGPVLLGGLSPSEKQSRITQFQESPAIYIQIQVGGVGVDGLQHWANHIVFVGQSWVPGVIDQAVGRLRRIGQRKPVFVHHLVADLDWAARRKVALKREVVDTLIGETK